MLCGLTFSWTSDIFLVIMDSEANFKFHAFICIYPVEVFFLFEPDLVNPGDDEINCKFPMFLL